MKKTTLIWTALIVAGLTLSACAPGITNQSLNDTTWELVSYGSAMDPTPAAPDIETTLTFGADGQVGGNMGCNSFSGAFELNGDKIEFGPITSTMMACEGSGMDQEAAAFNVLRETVTASFDGSNLTLTGPDGDVLVLAQK
ncbi:MAG: META domain-containing protein [Chloroflexota bacterium]